LAALQRYKPPEGFASRVSWIGKNLQKGESTFGVKLDTINAWLLLTRMFLLAHAWVKAHLGKLLLPVCVVKLRHS
jgi:hypothetical protein